MACMCGDTHCSSCGPAQGNWRCPICRAWADDGCEHIDESGEGLKEQFIDQAQTILKAQAEAEKEFAMCSQGGEIGHGKSIPIEPAWVSRFAKGNCKLSPIAARDIADEVRELLVYKRAMESMAAQFIHPKTTALELAKQQLREPVPRLPADELIKQLREAGGDAWDNLDIDQELAAGRGEAQGTEGRVCEDIAKRQALGMNKYGKTVEQNQAPLREWLQHAYEEALDLAIYLKRSIESLDEGKKSP